MGAEEQVDDHQDRQLRKEVQPGPVENGYTSVDVSHQGTANSEQELDEPLTIWNRILIITVSTLVIMAVVLSPSPLYTFLFVVLALVPAYPFARYIRRNFEDKAVSRSFLMSQVLLGAVPLVIIASQLEWLLSALIGLAIFNAEYAQVETALDNIDASDSAEEGDMTSLFIESLARILPLWKIIVFFILVAFCTAGAVEEIGKWIVARRYRKIEPEEAADADADVPRIGCKGILSSFCMVALGFAATENMGFVLGVAQASRDKFSFQAVGIVLLRGILAYPVHIGTQFYIGVTAAQRHVFKDPSSIAVAVAVAVLFHGMFDAVSFVFMILVTLEKIPSWTAGFVPIFDIVLIGFLLLLCRGRHKALLEREKIVFPIQPV